MSVDFNSTPGIPVTETESPMFAPIPSWERNRKRRGFGGARPAPRAASVDAPMADEALSSDAGFATAPSYASIGRKSSSMPALAIAGGIIAMGGLAAAGWYATQPHDNIGGVAQLTPGSSATTVTTTAPAPQLEVATTAPAPAPALTETHSVTTTTRTPAVTQKTTRSTTTTQVARAPAAPAAQDVGVNTAAVAPAPAAPVRPAFHGLAPTPGPVPTSPVPAPVQTAPPTADAPTPPQATAPEPSATPPSEPPPQQ